MDLQYNIAYHLHCQMTLNSGRTITLEALTQEMTYAGLLEGMPDTESNDWQIRNLLRKAETHCVRGAKPHLISPTRRNYLREPGDMYRAVEWFPHRVPEWLPMVHCIGSFKSVITARDPSRDLSVLVVVWYQDEYALPIQQLAFGQLLSLDWESLATDIEI
jgi:hypothetical protein